MTDKFKKELTVKGDIYSVTADDPVDSKTLAKEFVGLIFNRLINEFSESAQYQITALEEMNAENKDPEVVKELSAAKDRLKKVLSEEVMTKVMEKMELLLADALTAEELSHAIFQERVTIKIHGVAAQLESAFREALGED